MGRFMGRDDTHACYSCKHLTDIRDGTAIIGIFAEGNKENEGATHKAGLP
jgi:hypothetical protein